MPVRLLAFDSNGSGLELIERNELLRRLQDTFHKMSDRIRFEKNQSLPLAMGSFLRNHAGYAILSHTWIRDKPGDVVYSEWANRTSNERGFRKIAKFCEVAAKEHGLTLGWMDTVCINKDSSSELDESIRSMYKWYREAHVCVAYLSETQSLHTIPNDSWFTRGWTLQELLSPRKILFYTAGWEMFVHHEDDPELSTSSVEEEIQRHIEQAAKITGDELVLCQQGRMDIIPISRRIQLAADRRVTRKEDEAYSLMGILGVDISVAYGEGARRAFSRLMRELIMSQKDIMDIFNHFTSDPDRLQLMPAGVLDFKERSPVFDNIGSKKPSLLDYWQPLEPIIITHLGVRIPLLLLPAIKEDRDRLRTSSPCGDFFGVVRLGYMDYFLHSDIFTNELFNKPASCYEQSYDQYYPLIATCGIFNFGLDADTIFLPEHCMSVSLNCGTADVGTAGPNSIKTIPGKASPVVLQLESKEGHETIPKDDLSKHGMKLMTLYL